MNAPNNALSPLEWEIMNTLWEINTKSTVREVIEKRYPKGEKAYTTVQTVMNNLCEKGFLKREKIGMVNFYKPSKKRGSIIEKATEKFVGRVFGGSFKALANHLIDSDSLTAEEISELKRILEGKLKEGKK